jgi:DNA-binding SARP family transcriptional activator/predicted ATPase
MPSLLHITLLGTFQLSTGTAAVTTVNTPRLQALLAYLALRRGAPQSRQQLAFLLWPDSTDAQARTNLRTLLHRLRAALPDADAFLTIDPSGVSWRADAPFTLDVAEFEAALASAARADQAGAAGKALEQAAALYQGDLLPDCYDEWVLPERERLQRLAIDALEQLIEHLERRRDYPAAIAYARRLLRLDPLREATYLRLIALHTARGDRAGALRVYHTCTTVLDRELGIEPSPATRAAYTHLVSGGSLPTSPTAQADLPIGTVTFLFTDIEGSTRLWEQHANVMPAALARHDAILRAAVETHGGLVFRTVGDAICAAFTHAPDALSAALAGQRALQSEPWEATGPLRVRMALHTGVVEARDGDYVGHPLNRLARILATGHGGQILLSQLTQGLVYDCLPPRVILRDLGKHWLKDLSRPEQIFELAAADLPGSFPPLKSPGAQPQSPPMPAALPPAMVALAPLLGRAAELARAQASWQAATGGRARLLVLVGEAGIGKTRLAEELAAWAGHQGAATAIARCYATEGDLAYAPIAEWLRTDALRRRLARLEPIWLTEIVRLVPDVLAERPDVPRPGPLTEPWQRRHLFEALTRAILAGDRPLLLLIDDLQWCDRDTLEWLHFLLRYEARVRLLVVGTVRAEEAGTGMANLLDDMRRRDQLTEIALGPLSQSDAATLAEHMAGRQITPDAAAGLYAETEGNPLFVVESVRAGLVREVGASSDDAIATAHPASLPPGVQAVISRRLSQIAPAAHDLLCLAAVIGRSFTFGVLARAAESDEAALVRSLDELWQRRILREQGADAYDFSHDKLRVVAYGELSAARRRVLHRRVAEALEAEHAANPDAASAQIATHYERAGQAERAVAYYQRAANVAQQFYANAEAIDYLRRALALRTAATAAELRAAQPTAAALSERLADLLHMSGQYAEARDAYQQALGFFAGERRARAHLHCRIGNTWRDQHHYQEAFAAYADAENALGIGLGESDQVVWQAWLQIQFERLLTSYWLAQVPEMFRLIEATQPIAERYGTPMQQARVFHYLASAAFRRDRSIASDEIIANQRAYLSILEQSGVSEALPAARFQLGFYLLWHDAVDAAEAQMLAALELAERTGDVSLQGRCLTYLSVICRKRGQLDDVRAYAERSLRVATSERMHDYIGAAHGNLAWLAWRAQSLLEARERAQQAIAAWQETSLVFATQWIARWPLIGVALAERQIAEAAEQARALLDQNQQRPPQALEAVLQAAVRAADAGHLEAARAKLAQALGPARALGYL